MKIKPTKERDLSCCVKINDRTRVNIVNVKCLLAPLALIIVRSIFRPSALQIRGFRK